MPSFSNLDEINTMSVLEAAIDYQGRGLTVTPLRGKRPILRSWQERYLSEDELPDYFVTGATSEGAWRRRPGGCRPRQLRGCRCGDLPAGHREERQNEESTLASLVCLRSCSSSRRYFPDKPMADRLMIESREATLVELRSTGHQTVVAPSIHPA